MDVATKKIYKQLKKLIDEGEIIVWETREGDKYLNDDGNDNFLTDSRIWLSQVQIFSERIASEKMKEKINEIASKHPLLFAIVGGRDNATKQTTRHLMWQLENILPILSAIEKDIKLFGDESVRKKAEKIQEYSETRIGIPHLLEFKEGKKKVQ